MAGCSSENTTSSMQDWMAPNGKVKVLSTTAMINDLVKNIAGEHVDAVVLIKGDLDPHSYQLVKGDDEKLSHADLIFYNGLGLEHGPSLQHYLESNQKGVPLGNKIFEKDPTRAILYNGQLDPHIWMDISLWAQGVPYIVDALSQKDPEHAEEYRANAEKLTSEMLAEHEELRRLLQSIPDEKRYLVTSHDAFNYFTRAYLASPSETSMEQWQDRFAAPEGLAPDSQLSARDIQLIIDHNAKFKIQMLFPESNVSQDSIRKIVSAGKEKGLDLKVASNYLYGDAMGKSGSDGDTYLKMIKHNAHVIHENLK